MPDELSDQPARDRFLRESHQNFAVSANAGSGKTTAISERLAALALREGGEDVLRKTAVVTFTKKAAAQIGQRARAVLVRRLKEAGRADLAPLDHLERAFFGTIHSFCLLLAQRYGQALGLNLNPAVIEGLEMEDALWEEFVEQDAMQFTALDPAQLTAFLRHTPLDAIFDLARSLDRGTAECLKSASIAAGPPEPSATALARIMAAQSQGKGVESLKQNQERAETWRRRFREERGYLPFPKPIGTAANIGELYADYFLPVKGWLAEAGAALAGELALRYRAWRFDRGVQTYADQVEAALAVLRDAITLERVRAEGWRVILDEAQDTDPQQFAVLVEITRPPGEPIGTWPAGNGRGPRPGHFCLVGDGQQAIYSSRADVRNFQRHIEAFARGDGGEGLMFDVTFRAPHAAITLLNATLPAAFGPARLHNCGLPPGDGLAAPRLQVDFKNLVAGPRNEPGAVVVLPVQGAAPKTKVEARLAAEVRQVAAWLQTHGPAVVGARNWGEVCVLTPRNEWLVTARKELEAAGLKTALQMRKNRNGDNPAYAWVTGLLAAVCDPENTFEWVGVLRELFAVSDALIATELGPDRKFNWAMPEQYSGSLRLAFETLRPFVGRVEAEGEPLERFAHDLVRVLKLDEKARQVDPSGALNGELERLLAHASELGLTGAGPRAWLGELLAELESGRPAGKPSDDAINLLTSHSAKGLEWPVVIPVGLWRGIGKRDETGFRLLPADENSAARVFFDGASLPAATKESRERERRRELVRLLYVTLTRARRTLLLPMGEKAEEGSFLDLWGADLGALPPAPDVQFVAPKESPPVAGQPELPLGTKDRVQVNFPRRLLPHQLAMKPDAVRNARHESAETEPVGKDREDPIDYGVWWHETMEFLPWRGREGDIEAYLENALAVAAKQGFAKRGGTELDLLRASGLWRELRGARWQILSELSVVAPLGDVGWIDGVIDLVAQDVVTGEFLIIDWKTNRRGAAEDENALLDRLLREYRPQLEAYGTCLARLFPVGRIRLGLYASVTGQWRAL
ncbi:MAG TPA: UvrD-helicase domain-containing protein [Lacunisphaera sp.]|nr:UvrD-helicase domain-containing protein [Lacunisphaera sp.]